MRSHYQQMRILLSNEKRRSRVSAQQIPNAVSISRRSSLILKCKVYGTTLFDPNCRYQCSFWSRLCHCFDFWLKFGFKALRENSRKFKAFQTPGQKFFKLFWIKNLKNFKKLKTSKNVKIFKSFSKFSGKSFKKFKTFEKFKIFKKFKKTQIPKERWKCVRDTNPNSPFYDRDTRVKLLLRQGNRNFLYLHSTPPLGSLTLTYLTSTRPFPQRLPPLPPLELPPLGVIRLTLSFFAYISTVRYSIHSSSASREHV